MRRMFTDMLYGVRRIDDEALVNINCAVAAPSFRGIPIKFSDRCVKQVTKIKRWSRLNRPPKVRVMLMSKPSIFIVEPPLVPVTTIICHPSMEKKLEEIAEAGAK